METTKQKQSMNNLGSYEAEVCILLKPLGKSVLHIVRGSLFLLSVCLCLRFTTP